MKIELEELWPTIVRGARAAYEVDHHFVGDPPFTDCLRGPNLISRLAEECRRVLEGDSTHAPEAEEQEAIRVAYKALQGVRELEELARLADVSLVS